MTGEEKQALRWRHSQSDPVLDFMREHGIEDTMLCPTDGHPYPCSVLRALNELEDATIILQEVDTLLLNLYVNDLPAPRVAHLTQEVRRFLKMSQATATLETSI